MFAEAEALVLREIADREKIEELKPGALRVGYQGESGAFGEVAAAGCGNLPAPYASFEKLLDALGRGDIDEAVLPVENAVVGGITEALEPLAAAVCNGLDLVTT